MKLVIAHDLELVRQKYIEVIDNTPDMEIYARWIYGKHPTDDMIRGYIDRQEMYLYMDGNNVAGMVAVTMYQGEDYHDVSWSSRLNDEDVATLHILAITAAYLGNGFAKEMIKETIKLAKENGMKAVRLDALASNILAHRLYEGLGFEYRGKQRLYAENTGWTDFVYYELPIE